MATGRRIQRATTQAVVADFPLFDRDTRGSLILGARGLNPVNPMAMGRWEAAGGVWLTSRCAQDATPGIMILVNINTSGMASNGGWLSLTGVGRLDTIELLDS
jgi:hypothetical protein